jgi:hypothetical protein
MRIAYVKSSGSHLAQYRRLQQILGSDSISLFDLNQWGRAPKFQSSDIALWEISKNRLLLRVWGAVVRTICTSAILFLLLTLLVLRAIECALFFKRTQKRLIRLGFLVDALRPHTKSESSRSNRYLGLKIFFRKLVLHSGTFRTLGASIQRFVELESQLNLADYEFVIVPEENIVSFTPMLISLLSDKGFKVLNLQYTVGVEDEWSKFFSQHQKGVFRNLDRSFSLFFYPQFTKVSSPKKKAVFPLAVCVLADYLNVSTQLLWTGYLGISDRILVDSMDEASLLSTFPELRGRLQLIFPLEIETLILNKNNFPDLHASNESVVVYLPPNQGSERLRLSNLESVGTYLSFIREYIEVVRAFVPSNFTIHFITHPREVDLLAHLNNDNSRKVHFYTESQHQLLYCKFVIISGSALFRVLQLLQIPTLNWDVFNYEYENTFPKNSLDFLSVKHLNDAERWMSSAISKPRIPIENIDLSKYVLLNSYLKEI